MSETPVLYVGEKNVSSWSMRAWVALKHKGVPFEERTISLVEDLDRARRRAIGPTGKVPVLHHRGLTIPDSLAIIEYLDETYPAPAFPPMWPSEPARRAHARWLAAAMHSGFFKVREHLSFNLCFLETKPSVPREALDEAAEMLGYWDEALGKNDAPGPFLFGAFGAVDAMYAPAVWRLTAFGLPAGARAKAYMKAVLDSPAVKPWMDAAKRLPPVERE